jgi:putative FmdB family regulatory protein
MPTYEYICLKCDHQFEKLQRISDASLTVCPKELCGMKKWGKGKLKRAVSAGAGLIFKGSGFYITDYRSENYKAGAKKDSAPAGESKPAGENKPAADGKPVGESKPSPAKPETKPETKPAKPSPASKPAD